MSVFYIMFHIVLDFRVMVISDIQTWSNEAEVTSYSLVLSSTPDLSYIHLEQTDDLFHKY